MALNAGLRLSPATVKSLSRAEAGPGKAAWGWLWSCLPSAVHTAPVWSQAVVAASSTVTSEVPSGCRVTFQVLVEVAVRCSTAVIVAPVATSAWSCSVVVDSATSSVNETPA